MVRKYLWLWLILCWCQLALAQDWSQIQSQKGVYLSGEGRGATLEEADHAALADLISQISLAVSHEFVQDEYENASSDGLDAVTKVRNTIETYTSSTLTNTERVVIDEKEGEYHIGRFIRKTEIRKIFEGRERTVKEYVRLGLLAERSLKIDDALRNYYWAFQLVRSLQHPAEVKTEDEETGEAIHPLTWLPERIRHLFSELSTTIVSSDGTHVELSFTISGQPVSSLDFTYFDGRDWSPLCSAKSGRGTIDFESGQIPEHLQINYEYIYKDQSHINREVQSVLAVVKGQVIKGCRVTLQVQPKQRVVAETKEVKIKPVKETRSAEVSIAPVEDEKPLRQALGQVVAAIRKRDYSSVRSLFTEEGYDMFDRLIHYGQARILHTDACTLYRFGDHTVARSIQMSFSFQRGIRKNFVEDIVFTFDQNGLIECVAFGLDKKAQEDLLNRNAWTPEARQTIIEFLENYKTAYALKRLDYLKAIFDEDAIIIVGHVANKLTSTRTTTDSEESFKSSQHVRRTIMSKEKYMQNLERCFKSNEFINIRFANNDVRKAKSFEEYGIQIKQDYYSTTYGDQGYLYIQVNLEDRKQPIIRVRTWQPEPDPEIGLFGMGNW